MFWRCCVVGMFMTFLTGMETCEIPARAFPERRVYDLPNRDGN